MTFSFKGPTPGLACAWTIHFKRCQCEDFGSHTVLWLISHFYFLLYDVFAIRLLSVIFFFPILFRTCMKLFNLFSEKGEAGGRAKSKERTLVLMFKQPRTCSQFFDMMMSHTPGHLLVYASGCRSQKEMYCAIKFSRLFAKQCFGMKPDFFTLKVISERQ